MKNKLNSALFILALSAVIVINTGCPHEGSGTGTGGPTKRDSTHEGSGTGSGGPQRRALTDSTSDTNYLRDSTHEGSGTGTGGPQKKFRKHLKRDTIIHKF